MEKENIFITGEIHFLELIEKKSSSLVFKGPNDEEISCNESDVDSLDDFEIGEEYSMFTHREVESYLRHLIFQKLHTVNMRLARLLK